jgi:putative transposase
MVKPSRQREMSIKSNEHHSISIRLARAAFGISEASYPYRAKCVAENVEIADWLFRPTHNQRNRSFRLCFLYSRNVKGSAEATTRCTEFIASLS